MGFGYYIVLWGLCWFNQKNDDGFTLLSCQLPEQGLQAQVRRAADVVFLFHIDLHKQHEEEEGAGLLSSARQSPRGFAGLPKTKGFGYILGSQSFRY